MADEFPPQTILETEDEEIAEVTERASKAEELLEKLLGGQRELNEALTRRITEVPRGPLQQADIAPELTFDLNGLPDPSIDPQGYHKEFSTRALAALRQHAGNVEQRTAAQTRQLVSDAEVQARADAMIKAANPALDDDLIGFAAGVVANRYRAAGQNPMSVLRSRTEEVAQEVLDHIDDMTAKLTGSPARARPGSTSRTAGLVTPRARSVRPPPAADNKDDPKAFYKEFTKMQKDARIY